MVAILLALATLQEPIRIDSGRFSVVAHPSDARLGASFLSWAVANDSFPGLPRPAAAVMIWIAPDRATFREWIGPSVPEWGAAVAFPASGRIVMQGQRSGSDAGDPREVLRHELAHLALYEHMGGLPPVWFNEGYASYAAREWRRQDVLAANLTLAIRGMPTLDELDEWFGEGSTRAANAYALAHLAVAELAALDPRGGLARLFESWKADGSLDIALRTSYGMTLDGFEKQWRARTRRRYGALALAQNLAIGGSMVAFLLVPFYMARRRRQRDRLRAMAAADAEAERIARESMIEFLLRDEPDPPDRADRPPPGVTS